MGEKGNNNLMRRIDAILMPLYRMLPFTYWGIYFRNFKDLILERKKVTVLDLGCGDGSAIASLNLPKNFEITGVDIFKPYLELADKKKIYKRLIRKDVRKISVRRKYDIVILNHVLEHMTKREGKNLLKKLEKIAKKRIILALPIGNLPQEEYDNNPYQKHKAAWSVEEMKVLGYEVRAQGLKKLFGDESVVAKYGIFSYLFFVLAFVFAPILSLKPELGTYMICRKDVDKNLD
jgi:SAM-dependent methyltransferase